MDFHRLRLSAESSRRAFRVGPPLIGHPRVPFRPSGRRQSPYPPTGSPELEQIVGRTDQFPFIRTCRQPPPDEPLESPHGFDHPENRLDQDAALFIQGFPRFRLQPPAHPLTPGKRDWFHLLDICAVTSTLLADVEGPYHPRAYNDRLLLGLKGRSRKSC